MDIDHSLDKLDAELGPASPVRHHVLRRHGDTLLDIPLAAPDRARTWAATIWPGPHGQWERALWELRQRGYRPTVVHYGDVIEFGADTPTQPIRWYGHLTDITDDTIILTGPYPTPEDAHHHAQDMLRRWQATQLTEHTRRIRPH